MKIEHLNIFGHSPLANMKHHQRCPKIGLHSIFRRHCKAELSKLQNIRRWQNIRSSSYAPLISGASKNYRYV
jgi:hypothetical protein